MLPGVRIRLLKRLSDERGYFTELFRIDWRDLLGEDTLLQANLSMTYPNIVRAWHRHTRGQVDYFVVLKGTIKICAYDEPSGNIDEVISSGSDLQVVRIPGNYWHGFKAVGNEPAWLIYFVSKLFDHDNPDEGRRPWDDPSIVPTSINDKIDDPRVNRPWDWFANPHK